MSAGGAWIEKSGVSQPLGSNVIVENSTAHDVDGDGIMIAELTNGLLQENVVYRIGLCKVHRHRRWVFGSGIATPARSNITSPTLTRAGTGDGGDFDIDYFDDDNVVQYNYGHDSAGYCVAFFGAGGRASHNNVFRFNVCSNNGQRSDLSKQGGGSPSYLGWWLSRWRADLQQHLLLESGR